jgi:hypothetical protein
MSANPSKVWFSVVEDFDNFADGIMDADSFSLELMTQNEICWVNAIDQLAVGTTGEVWLITTNKLYTALTPTNFQVIRQVKYGSAKIQAIRINDCLIFVDSVRRKIRELFFDGEKFLAPDMSSLAEDLTLGEITSIFHQSHPESIIWATIADASHILSFNYDREEKTTSWAKHPMTGVVQSGCSVPALTEDEIWLSIGRTMPNSYEPTYIERFASRDFGTDVKDAFFVDSGKTVTSASPFNEITGLGHLEGMVVDVLGDGVFYPSITVFAASALLPSGVTVYKAQVGLPFTAAVQPMRIVTNSQNGTSMGSVSKISELVLSLNDSSAIKSGNTDSTQVAIDLTDPKLENSSAITGLFSGEVPVHHDGGFSIQSPIIVSSNSPLPFILKAIIARIEPTGR